MSNEISKITIGKTTLYNANCMEILKDLKDVGDVVTDPPYGLSEKPGRRMHAYKNPEKHKGKIGGNNLTQSKEYHSTSWDKKKFTINQWHLILEKSNNQIIWGWDYFIDILGSAPSTLGWDKKERNGWEDTFSDFELAYCSIPGPARLYRHMFMGAMQKVKEQRLHPTQKPLNLMKWCIGFCSNDTICDPFMGSGTTGVSALMMNKNFIGIESDTKYFNIAVERIKNVGIQDNKFFDYD